MEKKFALYVSQSENTKSGYHPCNCSECNHWTTEFEPTTDEGALKSLCDFATRMTHKNPRGKIKRLSKGKRKLLSRILGVQLVQGFYVEVSYAQYYEPQPEPIPPSASEALRRLHNLKRGSW